MVRSGVGVEVTGAAGACGAGAAKLLMTRLAFRGRGLFGCGRRGGRRCSCGSSRQWDRGLARGSCAFGSCGEFGFHYRCATGHWDLFKAQPVAVSELGVDDLGWGVGDEVWGSVLDQHYRGERML